MHPLSKTTISTFIILLVLASKSIVCNEAPLNTVRSQEAHPAQKPSIQWTSTPVSHEYMPSYIPLEPHPNFEHERPSAPPNIDSSASNQNRGADSSRTFSNIMSAPTSITSSPWPYLPPVKSSDTSEDDLITADIPERIGAVPFWRRASNSSTSSTPPKIWRQTFDQSHSTRPTPSKKAPLIKDRSSTSIYSREDSLTSTTERNPPSSTPPPNMSTSTTPLLLYSIRYEIRSFDLNNTLASKQNIEYSDANSTSDQNRIKNPHSKTLIAGLKNAICLDFYYSPQESFIFWIDVSEEKIFKGSISNGIITNVDMIIQGGLSSAEGLAVDWVGKNIYWVESTLDHIEVANFNGTSRRTLIAGQMESPRAIAVDPRYGLLFWTDWDKKNPRIERSTMSGDDRKTIVDIKEVNGGWPNGLTLDYEAQKVYWIDANSDTIHVVDYEGNSPKAVLRKSKSLGHPFAITLYDNNLYWTDWKTNYISTASKSNGSEAKAHIQRHQSRLFDIKVFHPSRQPKVADSHNPCALTNGNCSHLCLLSSNGTRVCACPHLMRLTEDMMTCESYEKVLLIGKSNEIRAVDITKPLHNIMAPITVPKVFSPRQFEFDAKSRSFFWVDAQTNEVKRASLAGNNIETIIDVIIEAPKGLALDWISGNIYVTSFSQITKTGKLFISNLRGEYISILMDHQQGIISPKSIAVHPMLGLIFCIDENEQGEPLIFMANSNGQNKSIIIAKHIDQTLVNPGGLAIDFKSDRVYWVDQASSSIASIQYYDIALNRTITLYSETDSSSEQQIHPGVICVDGDHLIISSRASNENDNIIRASKNNITDRTIYKTHSFSNGIMSLRVYNATSQVGSNACALNNGNCSQLCVPTSATDRTCRCTIGYTINPTNETECIGRDLFLIYSSNQGMKGISIEPNTSSEDYYLPPIHRAFRASSIDYVYHDNLIYWVDNEEGSITRINRDTTNHQVIIQGLEQEEYIGIDWVAGNVYWLDPYYDVIEVARLNGSNRYVVISGDIDKANGLAVNPLKGYIVWSDVGSTPRIERARLDGTERRVLVNTRIAHLDELVIDFVDDYIYWIDSSLSIIERIKADGTNRKVVYKGQSEPRFQEHFIAMAIYQQYLYVAEAFVDGSIVRFNKDNTSESMAIHHNLGDNIKDITIFAPQPLPGPEQNPCVKNNGGCQDLCLFMGEAGKRRCICSHGKLNADGLTCKPHDTFIMYSKLSQIDSLLMEDNESHNNSPYPPITSESRSHIISLTVDYNAQRVIYSEMTQNQICSVLFNGTDKRVLVEKQSMVEGIAFENDQLYWTSIQDNSISRLNTSSTGALGKSCNDTTCKPATIEKLIKLGADDKPRGIAVDICTSYIYWTNWNNEASIQRASPTDGYKVESIITTQIKVPNGIAIDQKSRKIYWCDARLDKIESCDMDGSNRLVLINAMPQHPFALAVWRNYIFWTDWLARAVFKADKYKGQQAVQIKKVAQRPMGIAVASPDSYTCPANLCEKNNGGCAPGYICVTRETEDGQTRVSCHADGPQNQLRTLKTSRLHDDLVCSGAKDLLKCRDQAIIGNQYERFSNQEEAPSDLNRTDDKASTKPPIPTPRTLNQTAMTLIKPSSTSNTTGPTILDHASPKSILPSTKNNEQRTSTRKPDLVTKSTTTKPVSNALSNQSLPLVTSSTSQPCPTTPSPLPVASPSAFSNSDCRDPHSFRCFLSDKKICISNEKRCDGNSDCANAEDEKDCNRIPQNNDLPRHVLDLKQEINWPGYIMVGSIVIGVILVASMLVSGKRGRRRWFISSNGGFNHTKMFEDDGTNIEISNPMFDEEDSVNLVDCPFSIDLNERTTNFSNPLYERQVLLVNDKNPVT